MQIILSGVSFYLAGEDGVGVLAHDELPYIAEPGLLVVSVAIEHLVGGSQIGLPYLYHLEEVPLVGGIHIHLHPYIAFPFVECFEEVVGSGYHLEVGMEEAGPVADVGIPSAVRFPDESHCEVTGIDAESGVEDFLRSFRADNAHAEVDE